MSSPSKPSPLNPIPVTPVRAARFTSATPGSASPRAQCSADPVDFTLVKIHTAKCSICDKRNNTDEMRRCKGCTWQICKPCQTEREQKGRKLTHGNLATPTLGASSARRQKLLPMGALAQVVDPEVEDALKKAKEEVTPKKAKEEVTPQKAKEEVTPKKTGIAITPPSSSERKKYDRKAKEYKSLAEISEDLTEEEEMESREARPPIGAPGSKRKLSCKNNSPVPTDNSTSTSTPTTKRAKMDKSRAERSYRQPPDVPAEWDMTEEEKATWFNKKFDNIADCPGWRPSQHPTFLHKVWGIEPDNSQDRAGSIPHREARPAPLPYPLAPPGRAGVPRKSGEEFMEEVRKKVRRNLAERYAWPYETPAVDPTSGDAAVSQAEMNLRAFVDKEIASLYHDLPLDDDQQAEMVSAVKSAVRKFGNDIYSKMAPGFKAMAKPGLELSMGHLTDKEKKEAEALIQNEAGDKLCEFEKELRKGL